MKWLAKIKRTRNIDHISYASQFMSLIPKTLYSKEREKIGLLIDAEMANMSVSRKNIVREEFGINVKELRTKCSVLRKLLALDKRNKISGADLALEVYDNTLQSTQSDGSFLASAEGYVANWVEIEDDLTEFVFSEVKDRVESCKAFLKEVMDREVEISCLKNQQLFRAKTDKCVMNLVKKAEAQLYELGESGGEQSEDYKTVYSFVGATSALCRRMKQTVEGYNMAEVGA